MYVIIPSVGVIGGLDARCFIQKDSNALLIGFVLTGIILGPYVLNQMDDQLLLISQDLTTQSRSPLPL